MIILKIITILINLFSKNIHNIYYPFNWFSTLHAARISLAFKNKSEHESTVLGVRRLNFLSNVVGYLVMAWSGSIIINNLVNEPYPQLLSVKPLINYLSVHFLIMNIPIPSNKVLDLSLSLIDGILRSGALVNGVQSIRSHVDFKHSLFAQIVIGTFAPSG